MKKIIGNYELVQVNKDMIVFEILESDKKFIGYFEDVDISNVKKIY